MTPAPISVERLRELLDKARVLPWETGEGDPESILCAADYACVAQTNKAFTDAADNANLIVAAVNALPALLHQLAELEAGNAALNAVCAATESKLAERDAAYARLYEMKNDYRDRLEAAERAREEFAHVAPLLLDLATSHECDTLSHDEVSDLRKLAAFLAASGGK